MGITAHDLKDQGIVDEIVPEPPGGAHTDLEATVQAVRAALVRHLSELLDKDPAQLLRERHARYRAYGAAPVVAQHAKVG